MHVDIAHLLGFSSRLQPYKWHFNSDVALAVTLVTLPWARGRSGYCAALPWNWLPVGLLLIGDGSFI